MPGLVLVRSFVGEPPVLSKPETDLRVADLEFELIFRTGVLPWVSGLRRLLKGSTGNNAGSSLRGARTTLPNRFGIELRLEDALACGLVPGACSIRGAAYVAIIRETSFAEAGRTSKELI